MNEQKYMIYNSKPATVWQDATPLGNGRVGAMMYGSIYDERILLNHEALYAGAVDLPLPDLSGELATVRRLLGEKRYLEADTYYVDRLKAANYFASTGNFLPAFDIHLIQQATGAFSSYRRELDMRKGIASVSWRDGDVDFSRELFVSMTNGLVVLRLKASSSALNFDVRPEKHDENDALDQEGNRITNLPEYAFAVEKNALVGTLTTSENRLFRIKMHVFSDGEICLYNCKNQKKLNDMQGSASFRSNFFSVKNASFATVVCELKDIEREEERLRDIPEADYDGWKSEHTIAFSREFDSMRLDLGAKPLTKTVEEALLESYNDTVSTSQVEQMALFGRYLLISSSYHSRFPANLQGLWNGFYRPPWCCTFFNNENIEMNYWQALPGNLAQTELSLFDFYLTLMEDYRENARKFFGCRGILLPMFLDGYSGKKKNLQPHVVYWTASSSWIANMFYDYYLFTRDETFLKEKAYPFMWEAMEFYEDFLVTGEDGKFVSYPSNSPENCAIGDFEGSENVRVCINATMDFAALKQLLRDILAAEKQLGYSDEKHELWLEMLEKIPPYRVNEDDALCEWMHDDFRDNYAHRHLSHLYPLFPGREITEGDERFEACRKAVELRFRIGLKEQTGWSLAHMANIFARLGEGDRALACLKLILRFCTGKNLFTYHNDWHNQGVTLKFLWARRAPFQIDANFGFTAAVQEMLIRSDETSVKIFPALPGEWREISFGPSPTRCGVSVEATLKDGRVVIRFTAKVSVDFEWDCGVNCQWDTPHHLHLERGESCEAIGLRNEK